MSDSLWRVVWYNDRVDYLRGTCFADAVKRAGLEGRGYKTFEQVCE